MRLVLALMVVLATEAGAEDLNVGRLALHTGVAAVAGFALNKVFHGLLGGGEDTRTESAVVTGITCAVATNALEFGESIERRAPVQTHALIGNTLGCALGAKIGHEIRF